MRNNIFGKRLKELRLEKELSQEKLGQELGFSNQTISCWETGSREPDLETLLQIAHYFDVALEELLEENI
ncbi:MAG: helix-turn-helix transcriptional regulator [Clostridia bacterium]|nr:helix-turn-helix transcriptional regulator [Clostridiales bacterium]MBQ3505607.1 helix-turn-helix transcriptional regulator [Clostridia bacterium]